MARWRLRTVMVLLLVFATSCNRKMDAESSTRISIVAPEKLSKDMPSDRVACYAINVRGDSLKMIRPEGCGPAQYITAGFVSSGSDIQASVPRGQTVTVDVYLYLEPAGANTPCPTFDGALSPANISNVYLIGTAANVSTATSDVQVDITANYTGQNIATQFNYPATCASRTHANNPTADYHVDSGMARAHGGAYQINARVGAVRSVNSLSGPGYQILVR